MATLTTVCRYCGADFEASRSDAVYCGASHRGLASRARKRDAERALRAELEAFRTAAADILARLAAAPEPHELTRLAEEAAALTPNALRRACPATP